MESSSIIHFLSIAVAIVVCVYTAERYSKSVGLIGLASVILAAFTSAVLP